MNFSHTKMVLMPVILFLMIQLVSQANGSSIHYLENQKGADFPGWNLGDIVYGIRNLWKADDLKIEPVDGNESFCVLAEGGLSCGTRSEKANGDQKVINSNLPLYLRLKPKKIDIPTYDEDEA